MCLKLTRKGVALPYILCLFSCMLLYVLDGYVDQQVVDCCGLSDQQTPSHFTTILFIKVTRKYFIIPQIPSFIA